MSHSVDTIAAPATPAGTSAIAVVRVSGPLCRDIATSAFAEALEPRVASHQSYRDAAGNEVDDVLVTFFAGPRSYTGEDVLEISTHGNPVITQLVLNDLFKRECRAAEAGEFTRRAFFNGQIDLSQAEAVMDLIHARSARAEAASAVTSPNSPTTYCSDWPAWRLTSISRRKICPTKIAASCRTF